MAEQSPPLRRASPGVAVGSEPAEREGEGPPTAWCIAPTVEDFKTYHELGLAPQAPPCSRRAISVFNSRLNACHRLKLTPRLGTQVLTNTCRLQAQLSSRGLRAHGKIGEARRGGLRTARLAEPPSTSPSELTSWPSKARPCGGLHPELPWALSPRKGKAPTVEDFKTYHELGLAPQAPPCSRRAISVFNSRLNACHRLKLTPRLGTQVLTNTC